MITELKKYIESSEVDVTAYSIIVYSAKGQPYNTVLYKKGVELLSLFSCVCPKHGLDLMYEVLQLAKEYELPFEREPELNTLLELTIKEREKIVQ